MFMFDHRRFVVDLHTQTKHLLHIWGGGICMIEDDENMHNCRWHFSLPSPAAQPFGAGHAWKRFAVLTGRLPGRAAELNHRDIKLLFLLEQHKSGIIISPSSPCARRGHIWHSLRGLKPWVPHVTSEFTSCGSSRESKICLWVFSVFLQSPVHQGVTSHNSVDSSWFIYSCPHISSHSSISRKSPGVLVHWRLCSKIAPAQVNISKADKVAWQT